MYYGWIRGYYSHQHAANAREDALDANQSARRAENATAFLKDALDRQALIIRSLLTMCERKGIFKEEELREIMNEIDLSDGKLDGKFTPQAQPRSCPSCGKTNGKRAVSCMYCGAQLPNRDVI